MPPTPPLVAAPMVAPETTTTPSLGLCSNTSSLPLSACLLAINASRCVLEGCGVSSGESAALSVLVAAVASSW